MKNLIKSIALSAALLTLAAGCATGPKPAQAEVDRVPESLLAAISAAQPVLAWTAKDDPSYWAAEGIEASPSASGVALRFEDEKAIRKDLKMGKGASVVVVFTLDDASSWPMFMLSSGVMGTEPKRSIGFAIGGYGHKPFAIVGADFKDMEPKWENDGLSGIVKGMRYTALLSTTAAGSFLCAVWDKTGRYSEYRFETGSANAAWRFAISAAEPSRLSILSYAVYSEALGTR